MHRPLLFPLIFLAGLLAVGGIAAGYLGTHPAGLAVASLIAAGYLAGAWELYRYRQATATLAQAVAGLATPPAALDDWLERLHPTLRQAVRLRVEGERAALPAPALTPYLVGLLVLLGMLGTLLGMMATLRGTGLALESAGDLQTIRGALAAPVQGLGFAFGTSIAGVATSAALGLLSALCRRERMQAVQALDTHVATTLRPWSQAWQREEAFRLLQRQTAALPALVERLDAMAQALERQGAEGHARLAAQQDAFHVRADAAYERLATSLQQALKDGVAESARAGGVAMQQVVQATMDGIAREAAAMHGTVTHAVQQQLDGLSAGFATATAAAAHSWTAALAEQQRANAALAHDLRQALDGAADRFAQHAQDTLARQQAAHDAMAARHEQALAATVATLGEQATALVRAADASRADTQAALAAQDRARLDAWRDTLGAMTERLREDWAQAGEQATRQQQAICDTLARTADTMAAQQQAHASETLAEISRLVQAASEAPRAAAEVVAELRQKLSDSMVRDTAALEERTQLMATLGTLLDAVNHASTEQRAAIDALVATSADLLDRVGTRFADHVQAETGKLDAVSAQLAVGAAEVASLGEVFGAAVQRFGASNDDLLARLQGVEGALAASQARSDEQLAYYVAQAREVIDLSLMAQRQIVEDLRQLGGLRAVGAEAA